MPKLDLLELSDEQFCVETTMSGNTATFQSTNGQIDPNLKTLSIVDQLSDLAIGNTFDSNFPYVAPKTVMLTAGAAMGLEVQGTFARRQGQIAMDLTFINKALQPYGDFVIQFHKNT
jgi:hypothetical protein